MYKCNWALHDINYVLSYFLVNVLDMNDFSFLRKLLCIDVFEEKEKKENSKIHTIECKLR